MIASTRGDVEIKILFLRPLTSPMCALPSRTGSSTPTSVPTSLMQSEVRSTRSQSRQSVRIYDMLRGTAWYAALSSYFMPQVQPQTKTQLSLEPRPSDCSLSFSLSLFASARASTSYLLIRKPLCSKPARTPSAFYPLS